MGRNTHVVEQLCPRTNVAFVIIRHDRQKQS